ncbi:MAG TPA: phosphoenolpyruvate synthase [Thermoanaerobaculia bacterium]
MTFIRWFDSVTSADVSIVGGKNASLGEMIGALQKEGVRVPDGFATTASAFRHFLRENQLVDAIGAALALLDGSTEALERTGSQIRGMIRRAHVPGDLGAEITASYAQLCQRAGADDLDVAVRSSATAEDLPEASFAGQQETFLNIRGAHDVIDAVRDSYASLFTDRAIAYRINNHIDHMGVALSAGVQRMVRSDRGSAGVMFTLDPETGFPDVVVINGAWGLGETIVQGTVVPDQYVVFKPLLHDAFRPILQKQLGEKAKKLVYAPGGTKRTEIVTTTEKERRTFVLSDEEILQLSRYAVAIERHYDRPMDVEWAKDGITGELFIVQARPETVHARANVASIATYKLLGTARKLLSGIAVGTSIASGPVCRVDSPRDLDKVKEGSILVTDTTDPDWVPIMKRVRGIVTDFGGRTCHAAIVARELGIPAIVGTGIGTTTLIEGQEITISCAEGERGFVYDGGVPFERHETSLENLPRVETPLMLNVGDPDSALRWWRLPADGVGLARIEFIIANDIRIHPMALAKFDQLTDEPAITAIRQLTRDYTDKNEYFIDRLSRGVARIAASRYPRPVIVRMSDFKTNEYAELLGGAQFEPKEANPMIGFRGACRYASDRYREGFALECLAMRRVREEMGFTNVRLMIPFCRTLDEADRVLDELAHHGLRRGENGLQVWVMCEIPSNVVLASEFAKRFDGFSIGSNDLTQLTLGIDRDSADLAYLFDERNDAVKEMIRAVVHAAHKADQHIGICGQAPSDHPDFAAFLVSLGIDSISLNPDSFIAARARVAEAERTSTGSPVEHLAEAYP